MHKARFAVPEENSAASLAPLHPDQLARRILAEQQVVIENQALLARLEAPEPIYATERSALPVNRLEIAAYRAEIKKYSEHLAAAKARLEALQEAEKGLLPPGF